jgi:hypothetical protein
MKVTVTSTRSVVIILACYRRNVVRVKYPGTVGHRIQPKILDMIGSLRWQTAEESYTPYQINAPPLEAKEEGPPTNYTNPRSDPHQ